MNFPNKIRSLGERFRNILYLVVSVAIGYLILVKFLSIMDTNNIGLNWLANNPNNGLILIFVLWLFLILAVDLIIDLISNYSKRGKDARLASADSRPKIVSEVHEEKPTIKKAQAPSKTTKKTKKREARLEGTPVEVTAPAKKIRVGRTKEKRKVGVGAKQEIKGPSAGVRSTDIIVSAEKSKPVPVEGLETVKKTEKQEVELKETEAGMPEQAKKIRAGAKKKRKVVEEPRQEIREPAANIQSTDTTTISAKKGKRLVEAFDEEHHVSVIDFTPNISRKKTTIRIERLKAASHLLEEIPPNIIFENFNIWVDIPEKNIGKPGIVFRVDKSWITENNLREIQLYKYIDGEWVMQEPAEKLDVDEEYFYFQTPLKGLSGSYAIVGI